MKLTIITYLARNSYQVSREAFGRLIIWLPTILKLSAQVQDITSWHCREVNLVDCSLSWIERNSKKYEALISEMTDFAHLNDYILLAINFKLWNPPYTWHTRGFDRSFIQNHRMLSSIISTKLDTRSRCPFLVKQCGLKHSPKAPSTK